MGNENSTNLWQVLYDVLGIKNPNGNCVVWTRMAYVVLRSMTDLKVTPMGTLVEIPSYSITHCYLKGTCPSSNNVKVAGEQLKVFLECGQIKQMVKNMPQLEGIIYEGKIEGLPGEEIVLDGTADQFTEQKERRDGSCGFYGPVSIAKPRLRDAYRTSKEAMQMAQSLSIPKEEGKIS